MKTPTTTKNVPFTVEISDVYKKEIERIAEVREVSVAYIMNDVLEGYMEREDVFQKGIEQAIASLDAGKGIPAEKVWEWVESWGTAHELPMPNACNYIT